MIGIKKPLISLACLTFFGLITTVQANVSFTPPNPSSFKEAIKTLPGKKRKQKEGDTKCGKRAATGGTQDEASSKKTKSNMTAEQETFVQKFKAAPSKVDKLRKLAVRHVDGRGSSKHKNGE